MHLIYTLAGTTKVGRILSLCFIPAACFCALDVAVLQSQRILKILNFFVMFL